jgi:hypothetical protein
LRCSVLRLALPSIGLMKVSSSSSSSSSRVTMLWE